MRKIIFEYLEVLNETEQLIVFSTIFDRKSVGLDLKLNTALPAPIQDIQLRRTIVKLERLTRKDVEKMS